MTLPKMNRTGVLIILAGALLLWMGLRSLVGYEHDAEHLHAGEFQSITCDGDQAVGGPGWLSPSADFACQESRADQRSQAPWLVAAGLVIIAYGVVDVRRKKG
jgi:hypothetical protein